MKAEKKIILVFIDWYLPGFKAGGPIRSCANLVAHLKEDFEFRIVCRNTDYTDEEPYPDIQPNTWVKRSDNEFVWYIPKDKLNSKTISQIIQDTDFDLAYINGIYSFYFSILPAWILRKEKNVVIAARGMLAQSAIKVKGGKKMLFLGLMKMMGIYKNVVFHATNEKEKQDIRIAISESARVKIAPNLPEKITPDRVNHISKKSGELKLISIARISPEKNQLFAIEVLKGVKSDGQLDFHLYGPVYNEDYWNECLSVASALPPNIRVHYHGSLPQTEVKKTLADSHYLFLPTRGENFGHIILESFAASCPVIISDQTPWQDLEGKGIGHDLKLDHKEDWAEVIQNLIQQNEAEYDKVSENAFTFASEVILNKEPLEANKKLFS